MIPLTPKSMFTYVSKSDVLKIVVITTLTFVVLHFIRITLLIGNEDTSAFYISVWNKLALPATFKQLMYQPWSLITYMFVEMSFWTILGNMIWLWLFGWVIEDLKGIYHILPIYIVGGMLGGICMIAANTYFGVATMHFSGAIASMLAVVFAAVLYKPKYSYWFFNSVRVPIWVLFLIFMGLNLLSLGSINPSILSLMLGGALAGVLYNYGLTSFFALCTYYFARMGAYVVDNDNFMIQKKSNLTITSRQMPYKTIDVASEKIDMILDKINQSGIESLSIHEKNILEEYSKK